ncbi:MAG: LysM peptidoglycan-binding domain-containing protein [Brumimicrobium sp.]
MNKIIGLVVFLMVFNTSFTQEIGEEVRGDTTFKIHIVEQGNTLYGLKQHYNTSIEAIIKSNPGVEDGLQIGQRLAIPIIEKEKINFSEPDYHVVSAKETLFGIAKKYGITVDELIEANPGTEQGLQIGQRLVIPNGKKVIEEDKQPQDSVDTATQVQDSITVNYEVDFEDSIVKYTVQKKETLYSISRRFMVSVEELSEINDIKNNKIKPKQVLIIPLKKERIKKIEIRNIQSSDTIVDTLQMKPLPIKEKYTVVIMLPLKTESNEKVLSGMLDENTRLNNISDIAVDFLMGAQLALDSLKEMGVTADVHIIDTKGDVKILAELLNSELFEKVDLIIGPFYPKLVEKTANWSKKNKIEMIVPTSIPSKLLMDNPYVTATVPSDLTLLNSMAKYIAKNHADDKLFIINDEEQEVKDRIAYFKKIYFENVADTLNSNQFIMTDLGSSSGRDLARKIDPDTSNFFICLSDNVQQVMKFINALNAAKNYSSTVGKAKVTVVGTKEWEDMSTLSSYYRNRFNLHYATSNYLNYEEDTIIAFINHYNNEYKAYPSKYAFHGFDVVLSQGARVLLRKELNDGLMNYFSLNHVGLGHGKENSGAFICKQSEFEIHLLNINKKEHLFEHDQRIDN